MTEDSPGPAGRHSVVGRAARLGWRILIALLDLTIVGIAVPSLTQDSGATGAGRSGRSTATALFSR